MDINAGDDAKQQCAQLLQVYRMFSIDTTSRGLSVFHPSARILHLRQIGYHIEAIRRVIKAESDDNYRVRIYVKSETDNG